VHIYVAHSMSVALKHLFRKLGYQHLYMFQLTDLDWLGFKYAVGKYKKNTILLEDFQNPTEKLVETLAKPIPLTHKYMTTNFPGLVHTSSHVHFNNNWRFKLDLWAQTFLLSEIMQSCKCLKSMYYCWQCVQIQFIRIIWNLIVNNGLTLALVW
jgi:hypothetical protein